MFYLEICAVLVQLVGVWLLTLLKVLASIRIQRKITVIVKEYEKAKEAEKEVIPCFAPKKVRIIFYYH